MSSNRLSVHVYPSPFEHETRILKVTREMVARGIAERIIVIATAKPGLAAEQRLDSARTVLRVGTAIRGRGLAGKVLQFLEWTARVVVRLRAERIAFVNCHSLSALPLCVILQWWHRATLVYEPHELETETATSTGIRRRAAKWLERRLIRRASVVTVVSHSIAEHYRNDYQLNAVTVVLNAPELDSNPPAPGRVFHERFGIPPGQLIFMYQGVLAEARGVHWLLEAFTQVPADRHLVLMGFGPLADQIREMEQTRPNIHLHPAVPPDDVMRFTRSADVGFALLADDCINHRCALPNKFFHYIHAGLPVIASDLPEMSAVIDRYACGWRVRNTPEALASVVMSIDREAIAQRGAGATRASADLNWQKEAGSLASAYAGLNA